MPSKLTLASRPGSLYNIISDIKLYGWWVVKMVKENCFNVSLIYKTIIKKDT